MGSKNEQGRSSFSGSIGFVMAAAGSAVGLGNIWRFPYLAARHGGGTFLFVYIILALTFGFTLLTTEVALGRKTKQGPLTAYAMVHKPTGFVGFLAWIVPVIILPYYCAIGGWVLKYLFAFLTGDGRNAAGDTYFTDLITAEVPPIIWLVVFLVLCAFVVFRGVNAGIEKYSRILMPILLALVIGIAFFSLFLSHTAEDGVTRTGLQGYLVYFVPNLSGMTVKGFVLLLLDAVGQLFFSISVAMGIMVAYGSYVRDDTNLMKSINQIEFFDTLVAILAGAMIVPAVFVFMGTEGMAKGPGLMFVSLPKVFDAMGSIGMIVGILFFLMVAFAAITSAVSVMEAIVSGLMDKWHLSRKASAAITSVYALVVGVIVCLGYNVLYFEYRLPTGATAQILDILDYISNSILMPFVALLTCIVFGWFVKPKVIVDEVTKSGCRFGREKLYRVMIRYIAPVFLLVLLLQALGVM